MSSKADRKTTDGTTSLIAASQNGHVEVVNILFYTKEGKLSLNTAWPKTGVTPLYQALWQTDVNQHKHNGATPLHTAAFDRNSQIVRMMINKNTSVNAKKDDGASPLFAAAQNGHVDTVKILIDINAAVNTKKNHER